MLFRDTVCYFRATPTVIPTPTVEPYPQRRFNNVLRTHAYRKFWSMLANKKIWRLPEYVVKTGIGSWSKSRINGLRLVCERFWHPLYGTPLAVNNTFSLMIKNEKRAFVGPIKHSILPLHLQFLPSVRDFAGNCHRLVLCFLYKPSVTKQVTPQPPGSWIRVLSVFKEQIQDTEAAKDQKLCCALF